MRRNTAVKRPLIIQDEHWAFKNIRRGESVKCTDLLSYNLKIPPLTLFRNGNTINILTVNTDGSLEEVAIATTLDIDWFNDIFLCTSWISVKEKDPVPKNIIEKLRVLTWNLGGAKRIAETLRRLPMHLRARQYELFSELMRGQQQDWNQTLVDGLLTRLVQLT